ncbi:MAG: 3-isopropylmalate dehydratase [Desulfurococcales archaeon]|nr:3-isopropylmalate dehydratase [Desulfurococcales archaeon]
MSVLKFAGRAWVFGDNISTDHIISGKYKFGSISTLEGMLPHLFEEVKPGFHEKVREGDVVVAGRNFGMGSSREHAPALLKMAGVRAIIAKSFARIFYRNAINLGLPPIEATLIPEVTEEGDTIEVSLIEGKVCNVDKDLCENFRPFPNEILKVIAEGGIVAYIKNHGGLPWGTG